MLNKKDTGEKTEDKLEEEIYEFIEARSGGVSFVEIANQFGKGKYMLLCDHDNVVFWTGLSSPVVAALTNLMIKEKRVLGCLQQLPYMQWTEKFYGSRL